MLYFFTPPLRRRTLVVVLDDPKAACKLSPVTSNRDKTDVRRDLDMVDDESSDCDDPRLRDLWECCREAEGEGEEKEGVVSDPDVR